jgi:hypothetical protein
MLRRIVSCAAMLAAWAIAGNAAQITIADTLLSAAGVAAVGVDHFVVSWPTFTDQYGNTIVAGSKTVHVANGGFSITLEASDTSNPKVPYTVSYYSGGSTVATQTWVINTPNPLSTILAVSQVNTTQAIAANYLLPLNQIATTGAQNGYVIEMTGSGPAWQPNAGSGGGGSGTVTSVGMTLPSWLSVTGSPVTTSGTLAVTATTGQTANEFLATPNGTTGAMGLRSIVGADLPNPSASTLGGIESFAAQSHEWLNAISTSGVPSATQPASTDLSDTANLATNAQNFTAGAFTYDFSGGAHTLPSKKGTTASKPATCTVGEEYFATDATAGQNKFYCTATNTWTQQTGGTGGSGTVNSGTAGHLPYYAASGTSVSNDANLDDGATTANTLTYAGTGGIAAPAFTSTGTTPGADILSAGTGSIPALPSNSAGFAAPISGGTSYLLKLPSTISSGFLTAGAPALSDGVNESVVSITPLSSIVGGSDTQVEYNSSGSLAGSANFTWLNSSNVLNVTGALRLSGTGTDTFTTPGNATVPTKINIPAFAPAAFGQALAFGITSATPTTARVLSVFDARTTNHEASIALFDPTENYIFGLKWDTGGSFAYLDNSSNATSAGVSLSVGGTGFFSVRGDGVDTANGILGTTTTAFASLPTCSSTYEGYMRAVTDSTVNTWGTTITGGGTNHVLAYCDGTSWNVMAK